MAKVINEMPKISRVGGGRKGSKYPLDEWFDGQMREIEDGVDFNTEALGKVKRESLINALHGAAAKRNLKIHVVKTDNGFALVAFTPEDNGASATPTSEGESDAKPAKGAKTKPDKDEE